MIMCMYKREDSEDVRRMQLFFLFFFFCSDSLTRRRRRYDFCIICTQITW